MAITNLALGKPVTPSHPATYIARAVDGSLSSYADISGQSGLVHIVVDLGGLADVSEIKVWHYYADGRTYYNPRLEISADGENWETVFDGAVDGTYKETSAGRSTVFSTPKRIRYVRDSIQGSTKNTGNHWNEVQVWGEFFWIDPNPLRNLSAGLTSITWSNNSTGNIHGTPGILTDGKTASGSTSTYANRGYSTDGQPVKATLDLGDVYSVNEIAVWHYSGRTYYDTIVEVSEDGITWHTIFDSKVHGTYAETSAGKKHIFPERPVRYVRDGIRGSTANNDNHWVEIQVFGKDMDGAPTERRVLMVQFF